MYLTLSLLSDRFITIISLLEQRPVSRVPCPVYLSIYMPVSRKHNNLEEIIKYYPHIDIISTIPLSSLSSKIPNTCNPPPRPTYRRPTPCRSPFARSRSFPFLARIYRGLRGYGGYVND